MRLNQVDLNLFLVFEAIYTQRNLTKAATVLCITQPAVSNALNRLRKTFDDPLFIRTPGGMLPTPFAKNIVDDIREALQLLTMSVREGDEFNPIQSNRQINCSMNDFCESLILPSTIQYLQENAPRMTLNSYYVSRDKVVKELVAGTLDFAFDVPLITDKNLCNLPLFRDEYVCVVRQDHPNITSSLNLEQYLTMEHLYVSSRRRGGDSVDLALSELGEQRNIKIRVKHHMAAIRVIERSDLLWTLPKRLADELDFKLYPLPFKLPPLEIHLFWHKSADKDATNIWLRNFFTKMIANS
ncbi:MAG: LysR family transcriptional regulator [Alteromonadaceae bacterium]|nr:LysR family transcriptional regulator [Alteromonadaceae bacterium]